jgi:hypothetical protein
VKFTEVETYTIRINTGNCLAGGSNKTRRSFPADCDSLRYLQHATQDHKTAWQDYDGPCWDEWSETCLISHSVPLIHP